jgi:hypothetical protein
MPAQEGPAQPATPPAEPARRSAADERDTPVAATFTSDAVRDSRELRRRVVAMLQSADTRLRRSETLLASSHRRLTRAGDDTSADRITGRQ